MPRDMSAGENRKRAKAKRDFALSRPEMLLPTTPRTAPVGATSMPIKAVDAQTTAMIEQFLARKTK